MGVIKCPECNGKISDTLNFCPHCGFSIQKTFQEPVKTSLIPKSSKGCGSGCGKVVVVFFGIFFFIYLLSSVMELFESENSGKSKVVKSSSEFTYGLKGNVYFDKNGQKVVLDAIYEVIDEKVFESSAKTSITQHLSITGNYDDNVVKEILIKQFKAAHQRNNFKFHNPATHYQIILFPKENKNWVGILNKLPKEESKVELNHSQIAAYQSNLDVVVPMLTIDSIQKIYEFDELKVINSAPLKIQISMEVFNDDLDDVKRFYAKQSFLEAAIAILMHTELEAFTLTSLPLLYKFNKGADGKIKLGSGLNYLGYSDRLKITGKITRSRLEALVKNELELNSIGDLAVSGVFNKSLYYNELLYNDQGGYTLDRAFEFLVSGK